MIRETPLIVGDLLMYMYNTDYVFRISISTEKKDLYSLAFRFLINILGIF